MNNKNFKTVLILGFGRFGKLLAEILKPDFDVAVFSHRDVQAEAATLGVKQLPLQEGLRRDAVFFAAPISKFEQALNECLPFLKEARPKLLLDVLSVKTYPKTVFERFLPPEQEALLTHPMFGPDSVRLNGGLKDLPIMLDKFRASEESYRFWSEYFRGKGLRVVEMSAEEHDEHAARSQGVAHFIGRVLEDLRYSPTPIDTLGARKLLEVEELARNDAWELFADLQNMNPYTKAMRVELGGAVERIYNRLLPNRVDPDTLVVGIQGGRGSFNEQAARYYLERTGVEQHDIRYLHTTENVLQALHEGNVDRGQFAIHNSVGGVVGESIEAMARYKFRIVEEFAIQISHALMVHPDADLARVDTIMTHPQVLAQCKRTLAEKYPRLRQVSGEGDLIDHALVAEKLGHGELPKSIATMGSALLAELNNLHIIEDHLEDQKENFTSFLWVERPTS
ncbi:MAG: prephenate dehydrogenase/arogenate dehydrogenase family protein [Candidatus Liptonbacteria bacterium]|nr:prephenate dehydrogenase/arogenate dehydrogenase family protein [Candidatus Liptonbacteria bacterium]